MIDSELSEIGKERLLKYLDELERLSGTAGEFVSDQLPLVMREMIAWGMWSSIMGACIGLALGVSAIVVSRFGWWLDKRNNPDVVSGLNPEGVILGITIPIIIGLVAFLVTAINLHVLVYISVAPRLYLLNEVSRIVHGMNN